MSIITILAGLGSAFFITLGCSILWMLRTWPYLKADELIYQLSAPLAGTGQDMLFHYAREAAFPAAVLIVILLFRKTKTPVRKRLLITLLCSFAICAGLTLFAVARVGLISYMMNGNENAGFIEEHQTDAGTARVTFPEKKKNLIYIFMESMEMSYADRASGGAFDVNYIENLTEIAKQNEDFSGEGDEINGASSLPGTTFTTGAIFAQTTGLPLLLPGFAPGGRGAMEGFFPEVVSLGDILKENGYRQLFLLGSDATFGGRRLFYESHGDFEILDTPYLKKTGYIPADYNVFWGMEDEKLFAFAKTKLTELAADGEEPFHLSILTVDTHFEDGYFCRLCEDQYSDHYANVIACQDRQVSEFVRWIQAQDFYKDTTIVVTGDHPTMDSDFCKTIDSSYERHTYVSILNGPAPVRKDRRAYTTMDLFPTTLASLGARIEGDRLGLGTNLYSDKDTLIEEMGGDALRNGMQTDTSYLVKHATRQ